jgi:hypothetical protein
MFLAGPKPLSYFLNWGKLMHRTPHVAKILLSLVALVTSPCGSFATTIVPGTSDPWLAGMPNGTPGTGGDSAPAESPVLVSGLPLAPGSLLQFAATGMVRIDPTFPFFGPDGDLASFQPNSARNGIAGVKAPTDALLGVFLDNTQPNLSAAPAGLDFSPTGNIAGGVDYLSISPALKQMFYIGDGLTSGSMHQSIIVPTGATRLYLGVMDSSQWFNNGGQFSVVPEPSAFISGIAGLSAFAGLLVRRRRVS